MQLEVLPKIINGEVRFFSYCDGVAGADFGTKALAFAHQDKLWNARPESDKVLEQLYRSRD